MNSHRAESLAVKTLIRTYGVGFSIEPGEVDVWGNVVQVTFQLKFNGRHDGAGRDGYASCPACNRVLRTLLDLAGVFSPFDATFDQAGYECEKRAHYAQGKGREHEVALGLEMVVRRPFARARNDWALSFMEHVSIALTELGCRRNPFAGIEDPTPGKAEPSDCRAVRTAVRTTKYRSLMSA